MTLSLATALLLTSLAADPSAQARRPLAEARETTVAYEVDGRAHVIERARTPGRREARFSAEPAPIAPGTLLVFEIRAQSTVDGGARFRCVAQRDVAECLGDGVRVPYRAGDRGMVLTIAAVSEQSLAGRALLAERARVLLADHVTVSALGPEGR